MCSFFFKDWAEWCQLTASAGVWFLHLINADDGTNPPSSEGYSQISDWMESGISELTQWGTDWLRDREMLINVPFPSQGGLWPLMTSVTNKYESCIENLFARERSVFVCCLLSWDEVCIGRSQVRLLPNITSNVLQWPKITCCAFLQTFHDTRRKNESSKLNVTRADTSCSPLRSIQTHRNLHRLTSLNSQCCTLCVFSSPLIMCSCAFTHHSLPCFWAFCSFMWWNIDEVAFAAQTDEQSPARWLNRCCADLCPHLSSFFPVYLFI